MSCDHISQCPRCLAEFESLDEQVARLDSLLDENDKLTRWKAEAQEVESEWDVQAVAKLLGIELGKSIRPRIQPKIEELIAKNNKLLAEVSEERKQRMENAFQEGERHLENEQLRAKLARMQAFVEAQAECPCCGEVDTCLHGCTFIRDDPGGHELMCIARETLKTTRKQTNDQQ